MFSLRFRPRFRVSLGLALLAVAVAFTPVSRANSFTVTTGSTNSTAQTLAAGQSGSVQSGGTLSVSGSTVAVTVTGTSSITNSGTIKQTGTGRTIDVNTAGVTLTLTNNVGGVISSADGDTIRVNKATAGISLDNYGTISSANASAGGSQALDWNAITSASNILYNHSTGVITASEADAVRPGVNGIIYNDGTIKSTTAVGSSSDGIDLQTNTGVTITNANNAGGGTGTGLIEGGRHGITGGNTDPSVSSGAFTLSVTNNLGGTIQGDNGSGINIDGLNANEVVTVVNHGTITGNGHDIGDGKGHDGDGVDVDGIVNLTNTGTIRSINSFGVGGSETSEGVTVGGGTITNSGLIEGAVAAGNLTAVGRGITLAGVDKDANGNPISPQGIYANSVVTNTGTIRGQSDSGIAVLGAASGFTVKIDNQAGGLIEGAGATAATVQTGADDDTVLNAGSIVNTGGNSHTAIALGAGNDQLKILGGSAVVVGGMDGGTGHNTLTFDLGAPANSFTHGGAISNFDTVTVQSGAVTLNGNNTYTGTTTVGDGANAASLRVNGSHTGGGAYDIKSGGTLGGSGTLTLATATTAVTVESGGTVDLGLDRLTLAFGSVASNGAFHFDLNGAGAGQYGQLVFGADNVGGIDLGLGSTLLLDLGFSPTIGDTFILMDLENSGAYLTGTFDGLADGAIFSQGGANFQIDYHGGDGNDLVLRSVPESGSTGLLVAGAIAGLLALRRRRVRRATAAA